MRTLLAAVLAAALVTGSVSTLATPIAGQGTWESTLFGRDLQGHAVEASSSEAIFLYDSALDVTWLRDTTAYGAMSWRAAMAFSADLAIGGFGGWRLPAMVQPGVCDGRLLNGCIVDQTAGRTDGVWDELTYLWTVELGNALHVASDAANTGDFLNFVWGQTPYDSFRWLATLAVDVAPPSPNVFPWTLYLRSGVRIPDIHHSQYEVMLLRDGDVLTVPTPASLSLVLLGIGAVAVTQRPKPVNQKRSSHGATLRQVGRRRRSRDGLLEKAAGA